MARIGVLGLLPLLLPLACAPTQERATAANPAIRPAISPTAQDVLFVVLGKMSLYQQDAAGGLRLKNHHFVAEIMPKEGGEVVGGTLTSVDNPDQSFEFASEGRAFLAHGGRFQSGAALHAAHPDGRYRFAYETASGTMQDQVLELKKRDDLDEVLGPRRITVMQGGRPVAPTALDPSQDLIVSWSPFREGRREPRSDLDDLIFVLAFDCFGTNVAHSGRPYQGGRYLTYTDHQFVIAADKLVPGMRYELIAERVYRAGGAHRLRLTRT